MSTLKLVDGRGGWVEVECDGVAMHARINELRDLGFIHTLPNGSWALTEKATLFIFAEAPTKRGFLLKEPEVLRATKNKAVGGVHGPRVDAERAVPPVPVSVEPPRERPEALSAGFWWGLIVGMVLSLVWSR